MMRIDDFPSFVTSKAEYETKPMKVYGTEWRIRVYVCKYCPANKKTIHIFPSSPDQPETLGAYVCGIRRDHKECSFDLDASFQLKSSSTTRELRYSHKFVFNSTDYYNSWGFPEFGKIDVFLALYLSTFLT